MSCARRNFLHPLVKRHGTTGAAVAMIASRIASMRAVERPPGIGFVLDARSSFSTRRDVRRDGALPFRIDLAAGVDPIAMGMRSRGWRFGDDHPTPRATSRRVGESSSSRCATTQSSHVTRAPRVLVHSCATRSPSTRDSTGAEPGGSSPRGCRTRALARRSRRTAEFPSIVDGPLPRRQLQICLGRNLGNPPPGSTTGVRRPSQMAGPAEPARATSEWDTTSAVLGNL